MPKQVVFLVHGMGANPAHGQAPWFAEVEAALDAGWDMFQPLRALGPRQQWLEYVPISYDAPIEAYLNGMAKNAAALATFLPKNQLSAFLSGLGEAADDPSFLWDDVFDVLYYRFAGDHYRELHVTVMTQIVDAVRERWQRAHDPVQLSMITHSLGTAVAHGALNRLAGGPIGDATTFSADNRFSLRTYMALANVSNLLWRDEPGLYEATLVRPHDPAHGHVGCVGRFLNVRNAYDPVPCPFAFAPPDWGARYELIALRHLHQRNVHAFAHYLAHPRVAGTFFRSLFGEVLSKDAVEGVVANFDELATIAEADKPRVRALADGIAQSLARAYADGDLLSDTMRLLGHLFRDLWTLRKSLAALGAVP